MSEFSLITHVLPKYIDVNGKQYQIDTRTCKALQYYAIADEDEVPEMERITTIVENMMVYCGQLSPDEYIPAYKAISEWMKGFPTRAGKKSKTQLLSYTQDHALIVSAFRQAYGITLAELKMLHWWEFLALLGGLPAETRMSEVMQVRGMEINAKDTPEQKRAKMEAKRAVAIKPKAKKNEGMSGMDIISAALSEEG